MAGKNVRAVFALSLLVVGTVTSMNASAATATSTMSVTASVVAACTVSASALAFAAYSGTAVDGTADLTVNCTNDAPYTIGLGAGNGTAATTTTRVLTGSLSGTTMNYGLYQDAAYATVWGDTVGTDTLAGTGDGADQTIPVYGRIVAGQNGSVGTYTDSVAVTVNY
ncbi:spore coat protein [Pseudomonas syringae]|uniref:Spore coat protein n=2 Tax=Pseudomonas syringae TaxID=317 RepID=A0A1C7Z0T4_PSESX|nr:spore coat protein [Pseudomonas syringae]